MSIPLQAAFSPSGSLLALRTPQLSVQILLASTGRHIQTLRHPRPLTHITWRTTPSNRDENTLLTTTTDHAMRIFYPVLDAPHHLQLHATIDPYAFLPSSTGLNSGSPVFWMNRVAMRSVFGNVLRDTGDVESKTDESQRRRLTELYEEGWDLFCRVLDDGSIVIRAAAVRSPCLVPNSAKVLMIRCRTWIDDHQRCSSSSPLCTRSSILRSGSPLINFKFFHRGMRSH